MTFSWLLDTKCVSWLSVPTFDYVQWLSWMTDLIQHFSDLLYANYKTKRFFRMAFKGSKCHIPSILKCRSTYIRKTYWWRQGFLSRDPNKSMGQPYAPTTPGACKLYYLNSQQALFRAKNLILLRSSENTKILQLEYWSIISS